MARAPIEKSDAQWREQLSPESTAAGIRLQERWDFRLAIHGSVGKRLASSGIGSWPAVLDQDHRHQHQHQRLRLVAFEAPVEPGARRLASRANTGFRPVSRAGDPTAPRHAPRCTRAARRGRSRLPASTPCGLAHAAWRSRAIPRSASDSRRPRVRAGPADRSRCASKPAETSSSCGRKPSSAGSRRSRHAARKPALPVPGGSGALTTLPTPRSSTKPVSGYSGSWCELRYITRGSVSKIACVPLPWWTSKSTTATRARPCLSQACAAATAIELNRQKPIATEPVAWWPGGRTAQNARCGCAARAPHRPRPRRRRPRATRLRPNRGRARCRGPAPSARRPGVSSTSASSASSCTRSSCPRVARGASCQSRLRQRRAQRLGHGLQALRPLGVATRRVRGRVQAAWV